MRLFMLVILFSILVTLLTLDAFEFNEVSVTFRSYRKDLIVLNQAIMAAMHYVPNALEYVLVVPEADYELMMSQLEFNSTPNFFMYPEKKHLKSDKMQQKYSKMHADTYCKGQYILHVDSDMVFRKKLEISDIAFNGKPILYFQHVSKLPTVFWPVGTSRALGRTVEYEFSRTALKIFPRALYHASRAHLVKVQQMSMVEFLDSCHPLHEEKHAKSLFSDFNYLGAFAYYYRQRSFALNPLDEDIRVKYREVYNIELPPHPDYSIMCQGNAQAAQFTNTEDELVAILSRTWRNGQSCANLKSIGQLYGKYSHARFNKHKIVCLENNEVRADVKREVFHCNTYRPTMYLLIIPPPEKWSVRADTCPPWELLPFNKPYEEHSEPFTKPLIPAASIATTNWTPTDPIPITKFNGHSIPRNSGEGGKFKVNCFNNYDHDVPRSADGSKPPFSTDHFFCNIGTGESRKRYNILFPAGFKHGDVLPFIV